MGRAGPAGVFPGEIVVSSSATSSCFASSLVPELVTDKLPVPLRDLILSKSSWLITCTFLAVSIYETNYVCHSGVGSLAVVLQGGD